MAQLPRGLRNNNPLNIRLVPSTSWRGSVGSLPGVGSDRQFVQFSSMLWGWRAALVIIHNYLSSPSLRISTPAQIIRRWAPSVENDTAAYIRRVAQSGINVDARVQYSDKQILCRLVLEMACVECGEQYRDRFSMDDIWVAYELAK